MSAKGPPNAIHIVTCLHNQDPCCGRHAWHHEGGDPKGEGGGGGGVEAVRTIQQRKSALQQSRFRSQIDMDSTMAHLGRA